MDATFDVDTGSGSTGAIIRDRTRSWSILTIDTPSTAEACALRDGLIIAGNVGCNRILVESDCMEVVEVMQNGGNSLGVAAAIYEECTFLCRNFTCVIFSHCPREANRATHNLAQFSMGNQLWQEPPYFIPVVLADDVTLIPDQ